MSDLERIHQKTPGSVSKQWYEAGVAVDPGTVTVNVTRADGTVVVTGGSVSGTGTGARTYSITTAVTQLLDTLEVEWVSTDKGTLYSTVEVVGGFLFTLAEARAIRPLDNTTLYTTAALIAMRTTVEQALEDACGVAFVPRYALETVNGSGTDVLPLKWPKVRAIRSASYTYNGTASLLSASELGLLSYAAWGGVTGYSWGTGFGNWTVGYEHGHDRPPERVRRAALSLTRSWMVSGPIDDRASTFNAGADGGTYSLVVPGRNGSVFGMPEVDAVVQEYNLRVGVA